MKNQFKLTCMAAMAATIWTTGAAAQATNTNGIVNNGDLVNTGDIFNGGDIVNGGNVFNSGETQTTGNVFNFSDLVTSGNVFNLADVVTSGNTFNNGQTQTLGAVFNFADVVTSGTTFNNGLVLNATDTTVGGTLRIGNSSTSVVTDPPVNGIAAGPGNIQTLPDNGTRQQFQTLITQGNTTTTRATTTQSGNAVITPDGNVSLTRGSSTVATRVDSFDTANTFLLITDPNDPNFGLPEAGSQQTNVRVNQVTGATNTVTTINAQGGNFSAEGNLEIGRADCVIDSNTNPCGNALIRGTTTSLGALTVGSGATALTLDPTAGITTPTLNVTGINGATTNGIANAGSIVNTGAGGIRNEGVLGIVNTAGGLTSTGALVNNGAAAINGTLAVTGAATTNGIANTGAITTGTLASTGAAIVGGPLSVAGATATNGITNTGAVSTSTLATTGAATVGGALTVAGASSTSGIANTGAFTTTGPTTLRGVTTVAEQFFVDTNGAAAGERIAVTTAATSIAAPDNSSRVRLTANGVEAVGNGASATLNGSTATLTNNTGHGIEVTATQTTLSGGTSSTNLTLTDAGATFDTDGRPARVSGVADGKGRYDAVNYGQLSSFRTRLSRGVAAVTAMTNIPNVDESKKFSVGIGFGGYDSQGALAAGMSYRVRPNTVIKASVGDGTAGGQVNYGIGVGASW